MLDHFCVVVFLLEKRATMSLSSAEKERERESLLPHAHRSASQKQHGGSQREEEEEIESCSNRWTGLQRNEESGAGISFHCFHTRAEKRERERRRRRRRRRKTEHQFQPNSLNIPRYSMHLPHTPYFEYFDRYTSMLNYFLPPNMVANYYKDLSMGKTHSTQFLPYPYP